MKGIKIQLKESKITEATIADDIIVSKLGNAYVIATNVLQGIYNLKDIIKNWKFSKEQKETSIMLNYLKGYNPKLYNTIEYY